MINIALSCIGRRNYLADYFRAALGGKGRVIGLDMYPTSSGLTSCDVRYHMPPSTAPDYRDRLQAILKQENVHLFFSLNDIELAALSPHRTAIEAVTGTRLYIPDEETFRICTDKWRTYHFAKAHGIPVPATFADMDSALAALAAGTLRFPLIVKPRWGTASIGLFIAENHEELPIAVAACRAAIACSVLARFGQEQTLIIQEHIQGPEYGVDILYDKNEHVIGFTAKRKLAMRAGETDQAVTIHPDRFRESVALLGRHLPHRGNLDCDFIARGDTPYLLELNPRFGGGYPFTHQAGADHVAMLLADFEGRVLPPYHYETGRAFAKYVALTEIPFSGIPDGQTTDF